MGFKNNLPLFIYYTVAHSHSCALVLGYDICKSTYIF